MLGWIHSACAHELSVVHGARIAELSAALSAAAAPLVAVSDTDVYPLRKHEVSTVSHTR